ncbi:hypothetical protein K438DRAFT_1888287 [Mycena galopus ATCC 62051]|nr:hypothetical protein K438DRAFT_1888287 [Mycena galopus ATCC 62051]
MRAPSLLGTDVFSPCDFYFILIAPTSFTNVQHPLAPVYNAGGSSSGCAALLRSNKVQLAIGGDQGG